MADLLPDDYEPDPAAAVRLDVAYGPAPEHRLDLHLPDRADAAVILYLHSGGWGGRLGPIPPMVLRFVARGYAVAAVGYRGGPDHVFPAAVQDVKRAIRWLKASPEVEGLIDGGKTIAYGGSSGGLLAALVAATPGMFEPEDLPAAQAAVDSTVAGVVSVAGPTDLVAMLDTPDPHPWALGAIENWLGCSPCGAELLAEASPITHLGPGLPPAYCAYGAVDPISDPVTQGETMAVAWAAHTGRGDTLFDLVEGAAHNLDHTVVNQRALEAFVDRVAGRP